ncbi:hypothetical protein Cgig2_032643 [Carnegiea gigantea]|uniref:Uncharacterized protein n=1 Tax=Carnegiea gigantea TaxID=171969 RepID=A0A9Q1GSM4_9CARY|nr:hypothetical protein Cgig2_032643 [Carnegiea gigantea]
MAYLKLIGARYVNKGYLAALATANITNVTVVNSPRDEDGHGSHTLSTAGGAFVPRASVFNFGKGMAKGGAPRARVAAYKVCWPPINGSECFDADIVAAFDAALAEGIDVISAFLRGDPTPYFNDSISIGSFHAMMKGVPMVCSAGNSGPSYGTVSNLSPWILTVGASTMDRELANWIIKNMWYFIMVIARLTASSFENFISLSILKGQSLARTSLVAGKFYPLISAMSAKATNASSGEGQLCKAGTLDPKEVKGKILVCLRGDNARVDKGQQVALAGGVGMILANNQATGNEVIADPQVLPASHLNYTDGFAVFTYINSAKSLKAFITPMTTRLGTRPAPFMAAFSSRGPNAITPEILKPDITAPGVSVIAAYTKAQGPTNQLFDKRRVEFNSLTGTSMSCPHHEQTKISFIVITARTEDNMWEPIPNASNMKANPFNYGAGHVQPNRAMDPGLVYDLDVNDYLHFLRGLGYNQSMIVLFSKGPYACPKNFAITDLTYPSITMPNLHGSITVTRTLKNVGSPGIYIARVQKPTGISVFVKPNVLKFDSIGQEKKFKLRLKVKKGNAPKDYVFGRLTRSDRVHHVSSPIVVEAV